MRKLNTSEIQQYARRFAGRVCDVFFATQSHINGKQILELCENKQVNLFVIKALFYKWQAEAARVRSPYFDYSIAEVSEAMSKLMNTLSRHIHIERQHFEPLLTKATEDMMMLTLAPFEFYSKELAANGNNIDLQYHLKPIAKYFLIHKKIFDNVLISLEREGANVVRTEKAIALLSKVLLQNAELDDTNRIFSSMAKVVPLNPNQFYEQTNAQPVPQDDLLNFEMPTFDNSNTNTFVPSPEPIVVKETVVVEEEKIVPVIDENPEREAAKKFHDGGHRSTTSMKTLIPLNQKLAFTNELFNGDSIAFTEAVEAVDLCHNYHDAIMIIKDNYFRKYAWDLQKDEVKEFYEIVGDKFE